MTKVMTKRFVLVLALVLGAATMAEAQGRVGRQGAAGRGAGRGQMPPDALTAAEIQNQFDAYAIVQAQDALQLSDEQYPQFVRRARALQGMRRQSRMQRNRLLGQLSQLLRAGQPGADEAKLTAATRAVDDHDRQALGDLQKAYAAVDEVLTPWQRGRFRLLEDQLEQKKLDMLFRARQGPRR
jgi:hypothetical protein